MTTDAKRIIALVLCILMLGSVCVGCAANESQESSSAAGDSSAGEGASAAEESSEGEAGAPLKVWLPPNGETDEAFWKTAVEPYEAEHNCNVDIQIIGWDNYEDKYTTAVASGEVPDVGYMYSTIFPVFIKKGAVADLSGFITDADRDNYLYLDYGNMMGGQYGLPFIVGNPRIMVYNKDLLAAANIEEPSKDDPPSWEEFIDICKQLTIDTDGDGEIDQWGFNMGWGSTTYGELQTMYFPYVYQAGGSFFNEDSTQCTFGGEAGVKAAEFVKSLIYEHKIVPENCTGVTADDVTTAFKNGQTAFIGITTAQAGQLEGVNWGWFTALKDQTEATVSVCDCLVMLEGSQNKEQAWELMKFMTSGDVMTGYHTEIAGFPPIAKDEEYHDNPAFEELYTDHIDKMEMVPAAYKSYQIFDYLYKNLQMVMMNEMDAREAVEDAAAYGNSVLAE